MFAHLLTECGCQSLTDACRHISSIQLVCKQCLLARNSSIGALRSANKHLLTKMTFKGTPLRANAFKITPAGGGRHCRDSEVLQQGSRKWGAFPFFFPAPPALKWRIVSAAYVPACLITLQKQTYRNLLWVCSPIVVTKTMQIIQNRGFAFRRKTFHKVMCGYGFECRTPLCTTGR